MKIIFLDIDGVLNNHASLTDGVHLLWEKCLLIEDLCEHTGAKVVVSSVWRLGTDIKELKHILWRSGLSQVIDKTPNSKKGFRGDEVRMWMQDKVVERYVIIDDDSDFHEDQKPFHIHTDMRTGVSRKHIKDAIKILKVKFVK